MELDQIGSGMSASSLPGATSVSGKGPSHTPPLTGANSSDSLNSQESY